MTVPQRLPPRLGRWILVLGWILLGLPGSSWLSAEEAASAPSGAATTPATAPLSVASTPGTTSKSLPPSSPSTSVDISSVGQVVPPAAKIDLSLAREEARQEAEKGGSKAEEALARWVFLSRLLAPLDDLPVDRSRIEAKIAEVSKLEAQGWRAETPEQVALLEGLGAQLGVFDGELERLRSYEVHLAREREALQSEERQLLEALAEDRENRPHPEIPVPLQRQAFAHRRQRLRQRTKDLTQVRAQLETLSASLESGVQTLAERTAFSPEGKAMLAEAVERRREILALQRDQATRALFEAARAEREAAQKVEVFRAKAEETNDPVRSRIYTLKGELERSKRELALEKGWQAEGKQALAEAEVQVREAELEAISVPEVEHPFSVMRSNLTTLLDRFQVDLQVERKRLAAAQSRLEQVQSDRRELRKAHADLLQEEISERWKGAAWVLRTVMDVLENREEVVTSWREVHQARVHLFEVHVRQVELWLLEVTERLKSPEKPPRFHALIDTARELRGTLPNNLSHLSKALILRARAVLEGKVSVPLFALTLVGILVLILVMRLDAALKRWLIHLEDPPDLARQGRRAPRDFAQAPSSPGRLRPTVGEEALAPRSLQDLEVSPLPSATAESSDSPTSSPDSPSQPPKPKKKKGSGGPDDPKGKGKGKKSKKSKKKKANSEISPPPREAVPIPPAPPEMGLSDLDTIPMPRPAPESSPGSSPEAPKSEPSRRAEQESPSGSEDAEPKPGEGA